MHLAVHHTDTDYYYYYYYYYERECDADTIFNKKGDIAIAAINILAICYKYYHLFLLKMV